MFCGFEPASKVAVLNFWLDALKPLINYPLAMLAHGLKDDFDWAIVPVLMNDLGVTNPIEEFAEIIYGFI